MIRRHFLALAALAAIASPAHAQAPAELRFAVTDVVGLENLQREWGPFQKALEARTGLKLAFFAVTNRTAAVEAMNAKRVDLVFTGPAEYVVFRTRTNAVPVIALQRTDYYANVVVRADSGITEVSELKGKKVAFGSIGSTSRHLGPMQVLADQGLNPREDFQVTHVSANVGFEALKRGDIAAMGMNYTDFQRLVERDPATPYFVIARGRDLPLDLILAGAHIEASVVERLRKGIADNAAEMTKAILAGEGENVKFKGMSWVPSIRDADYNYVRKMYRTIGQTQFGEFVGN
ncbi:MAG: phosphate/phosphite/phosphonate ABC transporter substrate-binding protein [Magnetospirillum sp.]|nr:phosphate/phosphite/phosphonate ABC transporter substrate-binding protein [Magnetospirillum sp.]